jgi:RimJ/RimL family protein N-acetyltransferase
LIKGKTVNLKPFDSDDIEFLFRWNNDPSYSGEYEPFESVSWEELAEWLPRDKVGQYWYIVLSKEGERMGQVVGRTQVDGSVQIGFRMILSARGKGRCTEAVRLLITHLFELGVDRVTAEANPRNLPSRRVLEKLGFNEVGYRDKAVEINGIWLDGIVYELRKSLTYALEPISNRSESPKS